MVEFNVPSTPKPIEPGDVFEVSMGGCIVLLHLSSDRMMYLYRGTVQLWKDTTSPEGMEAWKSLDKWAKHGHHRVE